MKKFQRKHLIIIATIIILLTIGRLIWLYLFLPPSISEAKNGILDLRYRGLLEEEIVNLDGEWMYYPEVLLEPKSKQINTHSYKMVSVPFNNNNLVAHSYGTYRLKVFVDKSYSSDSRYAIRIPSIPTATALYVNGSLLQQSGTVGVDANTHNGKNAPFLVFFTEKSQMLDIVLHVSNFDTDQFTPINKHIQLGSDVSMTKRQNIADISFTAIAVILSIHAVYSILIYLLVFRNKVVLLYVVGFLTPLLDDLFEYARSLFDFLNLSYIGATKISNSTFLLSAFFYIQFMRTLLTHYRDFPIFKWINVLYGISFLLILLLPFNWYDTTSFFLYVLYFVSFSSVGYFAFKEFVSDQPESIFLVITLLTTILGIIWGFVKAAFMLDLPFYPFDYLIAILAFASFWFKRFYENTKKISSLVTELQQADIEKDAFITNSADKLWDPLNKMLTIVLSIYENDQNSLSSNDRENMKELIDISRTIKLTLVDLTDFSRLKNGSLQLDIKSVHVHATLTGTVDMMKFMFAEKMIAVSIVQPKTVLYAAADEQRLIQILFNLLYNTIKYTTAKEMTISTDVNNDMVIITIHVPDLTTFEQQFQDSVDLEHDFGEELRLGFTLSKELIELHRGFFHMHSSLEDGTIYRITLPLVNQHEMDSEEEIALSDASMEKKNIPNVVMNNGSEERCFKILVINYDPLTLKAIRHIFSTDGYEVITVTSSEEALTLIEQFEWDLVIVDAMMPNISGYSIIQKIRTRFSFVELPIILLTARDTIVDNQVAFVYGVNDYVKKPVNALELKVRSQMLINMKYYFTEKLEMETAWLQAQIQPHFLFNTLNTIASLSEIDQDRMIELMTHFGDYLRASFDSRNLQRVIPIQDELQLVKSYLFIEQQRFEDLLHIEWDIDERVCVSIPPLSIQTLVENAVRHGVTKQQNGGTIWIQVKDNADFVDIFVTDDGVGMNQETVTELLNDANARGKGIGVRNTNQRLKRIFGTSLEIQSTLGKGTTFTMKIPKQHG